jgi:MFS family permease
VGPFLSVEQAILPQTTTPEERTSAFAAYNLVTSLAAALGALAAGLPTLLRLDELDGYRLLVWGYAAAAAILFFLFLGLSPRVETSRAPAAGSSGLFQIQRSRGVVARLAGLFALDAFAGGFIVQGLIAYWFYLRYNLDLATLGAIFFGMNLLAALSFLAAVPLARHFGLLNTMVFSHLPSNIMLMLVPFMPNVQLAVGLLLVRNLLSQLDIPTRQSYTMAIVDESERAGAAGILSVSRNAAMAVAPLFAGLTLAVPAMGLPFVISGGLKIVYDLAIFSVFRKVRPPEEAAQGSKLAASGPDPR